MLVFLPLLYLLVSLAVPDASEVVPHTIIPAPASASFDAGAVFEITSTTPILVPGGAPEAVRIGHMLARLIGPAVGATDLHRLATLPPVLTGAEGPLPERGIVLSLREDAATGEEGYVLAIDTAGVRIEAATPAGLFYGVQTLRQLMPAAVEYEAALTKPLAVPVGRVEDAPRHGWRGAMLDVSRHFFGVETVKRYLDLMALYKLNRLHLHLADDQGWRIEIPGWPRLTAHGGSTEVGGGPGGYYTAADYAEIVRYAADRFITIVPEIDMPGHINAALASYPELNCDDAPRALYTGIRVGFSALCVEKEVTYRFIDDVVREVAARTPGPWLHIGGDEVRELSEEQYAAFIHRVEEIVARHGKRLVGWDEVAEVDLRPGATIQLWRPFWDLLDQPAPDSARLAYARKRAEQVERAVAGGARLILSPADRVYLDIKYDSTTALGLSWAGYNSTRDAYAWGDASWLQSLPRGAVVGIEAPLWTETVATVSDLEYLAFPRLAGVAELGWSPEAALGWDGYRLRLAAHGPRLQALGVNFYRDPEVPWR